MHESLAPAFVTMRAMNFDLDDLRLFVLAAEGGNLTRAAQGRHMSLPAASARVRGMESQAGVALFERQARGIALTPAGQAFLHHARAVLRQSEQLKSELGEYGGGLRGHVRVFANTTAVTDFMPEILPAFLAAHPRVNVDLREKPNQEIARDVADDRADLGIVAGQVDLLGLQAIHFSTDQLVLAVPRGHRFARRRRVAFAETLDEDYVGMHATSTLQTFLAQVTQQLGRAQRLRVQLAGFDAMCRMVGAGVGVSVVPESAARRNLETQNLALVELSDAWRTRERYVLVRDPARLAPYAAALVQALRDHYPAERV